MLPQSVNYHHAPHTGGSRRSARAGAGATYSITYAEATYSFTGADVVKTVGSGVMYWTTGVGATYSLTGAGAASGKVCVLEFDVICARGPWCILGHALWCRVATNSARTFIRSCRSHERSWRTLLRRAEPTSRAAIMGTPLGFGVKSATRRRTREHKHL